LRIGRNVPIAPFDLLARIVTAPPPFSAVLADFESTNATLGMAFRPPWRPCFRNAFVPRSQVPRIRQLSTLTAGFHHIEPRNLAKNRAWSHPIACFDDEDYDFWARVRSDEQFGTYTNVDVK
jgi:hypothetical protein